MSFTVSMVIDGDASRALQAMQAVEQSRQNMQRGIVGLVGAQNSARSSTTSLTQATQQMERSLRSSVAPAAILPPRLDAIAAAAGRAVRQQVRIAPAANAATVANNRFSTALRNTATNIALVDGPLGGVASRFSNLATLAGRMSAPILGVSLAITALTFATTAGVRSFSQYESQMLTVDQLIRATGGSAGRLSEDIDRMSLSLARGTLASARDVRAASAQVLTFRSITGDTFDRTLAAAQDLAATGFGSVEQSAVQLAKALEDPEQGLSALRRVGVSFTASQMEMIKNFNDTGRAAEAQNAILAQVEAQVGGAGAAAGAGLAGSFDALFGATSRWFELVGEKTAEAMGLKGALLAIADGIEAVNESLSPGEETRLANIQETARQLVNLRAELSRLENDPRTIADPQNTATQRADLLARIEEQRAALDQMTAYEIGRAADRVQAQKDADAAQAQSARDRFEAVVSAQQRELDAISRTAAENDILTAQRAAGVEAASVEGQVIADLINKRYTEAEAVSMAAAEQEAANRAAETGRQRVDDLIGSLNTELAVLQAADPVMATMIGHRNTLASATREQAEETRQLVAAIEAEQRAQAFTSEIDRLQFETSVQGLSEVDRRIATAQRRLQVDPDSDQGAQLAEEIRQNYAAEQARRASEAATRGGTKAKKEDVDAASKLIQNLQTELDILRELDPAAQEMIRHREALKDATEAQRAQVRTLVDDLQREAQQREAMQANMELFKNVSMQAFDGLIMQGKDLQDVLAGVASMFARAAFEAMIFGSGPMSGVFGGGGMFGRADGGDIPALADGGDLQVGGRAAGALTGVGGPREDNILFWGSAGEYMVNARSTAKYRHILEAINQDRMPAFADGGMLRPVAAASPAMLTPFDGAVTATGADGPVQRIELVVTAAEGVTIEQVGEIAAGVAMTIQQGTSRAQQKAMPGQLSSAQMRRG